MDIDLLDRAIVARVPVLIKARSEASGRRIVVIDVSTEEEDFDGDVILQQALLGSAASFVATGHLDIDHKSEIGHRMVPPIMDPMSWVVGRPLSVRAAPGGVTAAECEISRSADGTDDPARSHADALWASLRRDPPVQWFASIYGFPLDFDDCTRGECAGVRAKRFVVKSIDWRSLAFTRTPKNTALKGAARIVSAKAYVAELIKAEAPLHGPPLGTPPPAWPLGSLPTMDDAYAASVCPNCSRYGEPSLLGYRSHFEKCAGYPSGTADILAHAVMHRANMRKAAGDEAMFGNRKGETRDERTFRRDRDGVIA